MSESRTMQVEYVADANVDADLDRQLRALLSICFTGPHNERFKTQRFYNEMPAQRWVIREPDRVIAHLALHDKVIGTPAGKLRIGGIAEVAVHPDYRGRGFVKQMLAASDEWLRAAGIPFGMLFGRREVYQSSGYRPAPNPIRHFDSGKQEWVVRPISSLMSKPLGAVPWPVGEIDLRGPMF